MCGAIHAQAICTFILGSKFTRNKLREVLSGEGERYCGQSVRAKGTVDGMRGREVLWME